MSKKIKGEGKGDILVFETVAVGNQNVKAKNNPSPKNNGGPHWAAVVVYGTHLMASAYIGTRLGSPWPWPHHSS